MMRIIEIQILAENTTIMVRVLLIIIPSNFEHYIRRQKFVRLRAALTTIIILQSHKKAKAKLYAAGFELGK